MPASCVCCVQRYQTVATWVESLARGCARSVMTASSASKRGGNRRTAPNNGQRSTDLERVVDTSEPPTYSSLCPQAFVADHCQSKLRCEQRVCICAFVCMCGPVSICLSRCVRPQLDLQNLQSSRPSSHPASPCPNSSCVRNTTRSLQGGVTRTSRSRAQENCMQAIRRSNKGEHQPKGHLSLWNRRQEIVQKKEKRKKLLLRVAIHLVTHQIWC